MEKTRKYEESETVELKEIVNEDLKKEVVAFANTRGGMIFIGIRDDGEITGISNSGTEKTRVTNMVRDNIKPDVTLFVDTSVFKEADKDILLLQVNQGTRRPYYLAGKGLRPAGVYVRQGNSSVPASEEKIRQLIKETDGDHFETRRSLNQELTFQSCAACFQKNGLDFGHEQMRTMHMIDQDGMFTDLALLLSDQNPFSVKAAVFQGEDQTIFKDRKEFNGSLLKQMDEILDFLNLMNPIQSRFENFQRVDQKGYPDLAVREAVMNALVHREYSVPDSTLISLYSNRLEIISIGGLCEGLKMEDLKIPVSVCRNRNLAAVFYRLRFIEQYGTGIGRILSSYRTSASDPAFECSSMSFRVQLPNLNLYNGEKEAELSQNPKYSLSEMEIKVLNTAAEKQGITRKEVEQLLGISKTRASRIIRSLISRELLIKQGEARNSCYLPAVKKN